MTELQNYTRAQLLQRYEVDEPRRLYLATKGASQYKRADPPNLGPGAP